MPPSSSILLRFESKNGQFRLNINPADDFTSLFSPVGFSGILWKSPENSLSFYRSSSNYPKMSTPDLSSSQTNPMEAKIGY
jgi:hypothetical protein